MTDSLFHQQSRNLPELCDVTTKATAARDAAELSSRLMDRPGHIPFDPLQAAENLKFRQSRPDGSTTVRFDQTFVDAAPRARQHPAPTAPEGVLPQYVSSASASAAGHVARAHGAPVDSAATCSTASSFAPFRCNPSLLPAGQHTQRTSGSSSASAVRSNFGAHRYRSSGSVSSFARIPFPYSGGFRGLFTFTFPCAGGSEPLPIVDDSTTARHIQ